MLAKKAQLIAQKKKNRRLKRKAKSSKEKSSVVNLSGIDCDPFEDDDALIPGEFYWSPGLKKLCGIEELSDEQILEQEGGCSFCGRGVK